MQEDLRDNQFKKIKVIGIGSGRGGGIGPHLAKAIEGCDVVFAGRYAKLVIDGLIEEGLLNQEITANIRPLPLPVSDGVKELLRLQEAGRAVGVLVSGDPLFFSLGNYILKQIDREKIEFYSNATIAQAAFSMLKLPMNEARIISLHGRDIKNVLPYAFLNRIIGIYTDLENSPSKIADIILKKTDTPDRFYMYVLEAIGLGSKERVYSLTLEEARLKRFFMPNFVVLKNDAPLKYPVFGLSEDCYRKDTDDKVPVTSQEVRSVAISLLLSRNGCESADSEALTPVLWDIGAGAGSISIETASFMPFGRVFAIEKDDKRAGLIAENIRRFSAFNVDIIAQDAPSCLYDLPSPNKVFIGGGGRRLASIMECVFKRLMPDGVMVISCVMLSSLNAAVSFFKNKGIGCRVIGLNVSRSKEIADDIYLKAKNPVWLVTGRKT